MQRPPEHETPPPLGSWARLYLLVIATAVGLIGLLWWFTATWNVGGMP